jgi:RNA polymerase sigma factor (sigma-70 family)
VINVSLQKFREKKHLEIVSDSFLTIEDEINEEDDFKTAHLSEVFLLKLIQDLPERYRLVFNLYAIDGFSHNDIAKMLSTNIGTSKSNLFRARAILKEKIIATQQNLSFYGKEKQNR